MSGSLYIGVVLGWLHDRDPAAALNSRSALRPLFPAMAHLSSSEFGIFLNNVPLSEVAAKLATNTLGWTDEVAAELDRHGFTSATYQVLYPRDARRLVALGDQLGAKIVDAPLLPGWEALKHLLVDAVPATKERVLAFQAAGVKLVGVYDLTGLSIEAACKKAQMLHYSFGVLAKRASCAGLAPRDFGREVLRGERVSEIAEFTPPSTYHYYARNCWNAIGRSHPELGLPFWPDRTRKVSLPKERRPPVLVQGIEEALFNDVQQRTLSKHSLKTYGNTMNAYWGILDAEGVGLDVLLSGLSPKDAVRLLCQGVPREMLSGIPEQDSPRGLALRLQDDVEFKECMLKMMRAREASHEGKEAGENPFVSIALDVRYEAAQYPAANNLVDRISVINQRYLCMRGPNLQWIEARLAEVKKLEKKTKTAYDRKKAIVFKHPKLWERLMDCLDVMIADFEKMKPGTARWATTLRDIVFFYVILLFPLRIANHLHMELGVHFDPETGHIHFDADDLVKNETVLDYELPDAGRHARVRTLMALYLDQARPLLLHGATSPYVYVPDRSVPNAGIQIREKGFNEILIALSKRYLKDVLPASLGFLNPHLVRHIVATYQIMVKKDTIRAAQLLADTLQTILRHYSDILGSARDELKDYYNAEE